MYISLVLIQSRALHFLQTIMSLAFFLISLMWTTDKVGWLAAAVMAAIYLMVLVMGSITEEVRMQMMYEPPEEVDEEGS